MSNIDKQAVQAVADLKAGYTLGHADVAILNELARIALASLEAEPVAYFDPFAFHNFSVYRAGETDNKRMGREWIWANPDAGLIPVYTAPPAPVSVPAAYEHTEDFSEYHEGWNACRAAMLQGAERVTTAYKLPDGYTLVPVEPTYQMCEAMGLPWESPRFPDRYKAMIAAAPPKEKRDA